MGCVRLEPDELQLVRLTAAKSTGNLSRFLPKGALHTASPSAQTMNHPRTLLFRGLEPRHAELPQQEAPLVSELLVGLISGGAHHAVTACIVHPQ